MAELLEAVKRQLEQKAAAGGSQTTGVVGPTEPTGVSPELIEAVRRQIEQEVAAAGGNQAIVRKAISPTQLAKELGVSPAAMLRACRNRSIRCVRFGRRLLIPADEGARIMREGMLPVTTEA